MNFFCILCLMSTLVLTRAKWNISDNSCNHLEPSDLAPLKDCNIELDSNHVLHVKCDMYCYVTHYSLTMGVWKDVTTLSVGLISEEPITNLTDPVCMYLANVTVQKFRTTVNYEHYGNFFTIFAIFQNDLVEIQQAYTEFLFNHKRAYAIVQSYGNCSGNPSLTQNFGNSRVNECRIDVQSIAELVSFDAWINNFSPNLSIFENIVKTLDDFFFLENGTIPIIKIQFGPPIQTIQMPLEIISYFNVTTLDFSKSHFTKIALGECPNMPSVKYLNLSKCEIEHIEPRSLDGLFDLIELNLSYNKLSSIPDAICTPVSLATVDLTGNRPKNKEFQLNTSIPCDVTKLILSKINFYELRAKSFDSFPNLHHLEMRQCSIREISENTFFANSLNLESLDLSDNQLSYLAENAFASLKSLKRLNLAKNNFAIFPLKQVIPLFRLQSLNFSYNVIRNIPNMDNVTINLIDLSNNLIKEWKNPIHFPHLKTLILRSNEITVVTKSMANSFELIDVDLSGNPFDCSPCAVYHFYTWYNEAKAHSKDFICKFPSEYMDKSLLDLHEDSSACEKHVEQPTTYIIIIYVLSGIIILLILILVTAYAVKKVVSRRRRIELLLEGDS